MQGRQATKNRQWTQKSLKFTKKQSHSQNLIALTKHSTSTFLTSSQDCTVRLWDLRTQSSIKLIRNKCLTQQLSNPQTNGNSSVYIASKQKLYMFDLRKQLVFVDQVSKETSESHYDNIDQIKYSEKYKQILCCDDEGDIRSYNSQTLQIVNRLEQQHVNICNCIQYMYPQNKQFEDMRICISGGFDCTLIIWNIDKQEPIKKIPLTDILQKYRIQSDIDSQYPFIHCLFSYGSSALIGIESGYMICLPINQPKKPKFILHASLQRITDVILTNLFNKKIMITCAIDNSFTFFDYEQRINGQPKFLQKYGTIAQPLQVQVIGNYILVVSQSPSLSFYQIKT